MSVILDGHVADLGNVVAQYQPMPHTTIAEPIATPSMSWLLRTAVQGAVCR
jgi:hypothetical protein